MKQVRRQIANHVLPIGLSLLAAAALAATVIAPGGWSWILRPWNDDPHHHLPAWQAWHARFMVAGWGLLIPIGVLAARYFKVMPGQDWPRELDRRTWWHLHRSAQGVGYGAALVGLVLSVAFSSAGSPAMRVHGWLGWLVMAGGALQIGSGLVRGTKGAAPRKTAGVRAARGDHYDMTRWRVGFERFHKFVGLFVVLAAVSAILLGLYGVNAPRWMGLMLGYWWLLLLLLARTWQREGRCIDTYQAIWGPGQEHPGNARSPIGLGVRQYPPGADRL